MSLISEVEGVLPEELSSSALIQEEDYTLNPRLEFDTVNAVKGRKG